MTEDDTYNALRRIPVEEVLMRILTAGYNPRGRPTDRIYRNFWRIHMCAPNCDLWLQNHLNSLGILGWTVDEIIEYLIVQVEEWDNAK